MKLIVGLGNPGTEYTKARHNIGWRVLDALNLDFHAEKKFQAEVAKQNDVLWCKSHTFMNNSGIAVRALAEYYHIPTTNILVIHDDKDIPFGLIRVRSNGSSGGHNGVQSIIQHLGTQEFGRIRIGVLNDSPIHDTADFVLNRFSKEEEVQIAKIISTTKHILENSIIQNTLAHTDYSIFR